MMACDSADITLPSRASPAIWRFHPHVARRVAEQMRRLGEQSPLLSPNMRRWKWIPFSPENLFPPSSLTLNNSLTCQSCFTRRRQGWIFEAKAGDEQSPPVYRPPSLYWAADGTRRPSAYCTYLSSAGPYIGADAPACTHKCQQSASPQTRWRERERLWRIVVLVWTQFSVGVY